MQCLKKESIIAILILVLSFIFNCDKNPTEPKAAKMELNRSEIAFGPTETMETFIITNSGEKDLTWEISS